MKLSRFFAGLAPALAIAALVGFAAPAPSRPDDGARRGRHARGCARRRRSRGHRSCDRRQAGSAADSRLRRRRRGYRRHRQICGRPGRPRRYDKLHALGRRHGVDAEPRGLVLMMTIPGLGLFYGGMVRKKNVGDTVMTSFAITCLVTVLYAVVTYSTVVHRRRSRLSAASAGCSCRGY